MRPAMMRKQFERQGVYRALRQAGARAGDRVRLLDFEFELDDLPDAPKGWLPNSDGVKDYQYIEIPAGRLGRLEPDEVKALAADVLPRVIKKLVTASSEPGKARLQ
jgi:hypothetical protein